MMEMQKEPRRGTFSYIVRKSARKKNAKRVALILSLSAPVNHADVKKSLGCSLV